MHKVSVIIPTHNSEETLDRALLSVLGQKGMNKEFRVEILICDDASTDNTIEVARRYLGFENVRIFHNSKNSGGPNWGRNKGLVNATGDLIAFLDHDDKWVHDKLTTQIKEIDNGAEFVYSLNLKGV